MPAGGKPYSQFRPVRKPRKPVRPGMAANRPTGMGSPSAQRPPGKPTRGPAGGSPTKPVVGAYSSPSGMASRVASKMTGSTATRVKRKKGKRGMRPQGYRPR